MDALQQFKAKTTPQQKSTLPASATAPKTTTTPKKTTTTTPIASKTVTPLPSSSQGIKLINQIIAGEKPAVEIKQEQPTAYSPPKQEEIKPEQSKTTITLEHLAQMQTLTAPRTPEQGYSIKSEPTPQGQLITETIPIRDSSVKEIPLKEVKQTTVKGFNILGVPLIYEAKTITLTPQEAQTEKAWQELNQQYTLEQQIVREKALGILEVFDPGFYIAGFQGKAELYAHEKDLAITQQIQRGDKMGAFIELQKPAYENVIIPFASGMVLTKVLGPAFSYIGRAGGKVLAEGGTKIAPIVLGKTMQYFPYIAGGGFIGPIVADVAITHEMETRGLIPEGSTATKLLKTVMQLSAFSLGAMANPELPSLRGGMEKAKIGLQEKLPNIYKTGENISIRLEKFKLANADIRIARQMGKTPMGRIESYAWFEPTITERIGGYVGKTRSLIGNLTDRDLVIFDTRFSPSSQEKPFGSIRFRDIQAGIEIAKYVPSEYEIYISGKFVEAPTRYGEMLLRLEGKPSSGGVQLFMDTTMFGPGTQKFAMFSISERNLMGKPLEPFRGNRIDVTYKGTKLIPQIDEAKIGAKNVFEGNYRIVRDTYVEPDYFIADDIVASYAGTSYDFKDIRMSMKEPGTRMFKETTSVFEMKRPFEREIDLNIYLRNTPKGEFARVKTSLKYYKGVSEFGLPSESMGIERTITVKNKDLFALMEKPFEVSKVISSSRGRYDFDTSYMVTKVSAKYLNDIEFGIINVSKYWEKTGIKSSQGTGLIDITFEDLLSSKIEKNIYEQLPGIKQKTKQNQISDLIPIQISNQALFQDVSLGSVQIPIQQQQQVQLQLQEQEQVQIQLQKQVQLQIPQQELITINIEPEPIITPDFTIIVPPPIIPPPTKRKKPKDDFDIKMLTMEDWHFRHKGFPVVTSDFFRKVNLKLPKMKI